MPVFTLQTKSNLLLAETQLLIVIIYFIDEYLESPIC